MSGFYKNENGVLLHGPNFVLNADYELRAETKDDYEYPIDGWCWFDTVEEAQDFFEITPIVNSDKEVSKQWLQ